MIPLLIIGLLMWLGGVVLVFLPGILPTVMGALAIAGGAALATSAWIDTHPEMVESEAQKVRGNRGFGQGDLRIDKPVDASHLDMMIGDALADHGFDVTIVEVTEEWTQTSGSTVMAGTANVVFGTPDGEWFGAVQYEVTPTRRHGTYDFSDLYVTLFIEPGWKRALEPEVKARG